MNDLIHFFRHDIDIISVMTFFPCLGALFVLCWPRRHEEWTRWIALAGSAAPLFFIWKILRYYDPATAGIQFSNKMPWIDTIRVDYFVGVDGLSIAMVLLVSILTPLTILGAHHGIALNPGKAGLKPFFALILMEQTGLYGAFTALNFFHWFIFWEVSLVPMFFLIKLYGNGDRTRASYQFFVYTFVGSVMMLIGMQFVYLATHSWDLVELARMARETAGGTGSSVLAVKIQGLADRLGAPFLAKYSVTAIFLLVFAGFAVKTPLWPFHTWLPVTYTQAPTAGSMLLTGVMSKMGVYGFLRIVLPLFGSSVGEYRDILLLLAVATILMGAIAALAQRDLKTMIAYSSVNHLGYCMLGVFAVTVATGNVNDRALALNGVIIQMFAHGLSAAGLFYFAGVIEQRTRTREMEALGGLRKTAPVMCGLMGITMFASLGLPGLAGFVGEFMIFRGAFPLAMGITSLAVVGILITAIYLLRMTGLVFFGPQDDKWNGVADLDGREKIIGGILAALLFWVGLRPDALARLSNSAVVEMARFWS